MRYLEGLISVLQVRKQRVRELNRPESHRQKGVENCSSNSYFSNCKVQTLILRSPVIDKPQHRYGYQSAYVRITWGANTDSENNLEKLTERVSVGTKSWHF